MDIVVSPIETNSSGMVVNCEPYSSRLAREKAGFRLSDTLQS